MSDEQSFEDYERLASSAYDAAAAAGDEPARTAHLAKAAFYGYQARKCRVSTEAAIVRLSIIMQLTEVLDQADALGLMEAALHIDAAIIALGGEGVAPPKCAR